MVDDIRIDSLVINNKKNQRKQKLGQFYTTNTDYILQGFQIPDKNIIEPFAGNGDLVKFYGRDKYKFECYDIDPKQDYIVKRDTILHPPDYNGKYLLTNPPYLARNKSQDKTLFDKYEVNDLYKCVIKEIIKPENRCLGGILIIPLNFWSSIRIADIELRKQFLEVYKINGLNIFEEQVFNDTSYTICSFQFTLYHETPINLSPINIVIYPGKKTISAVLNENNNYLIGGDIYKLPLKNKYNITRATSSNKSALNTNILVKCIDDNAANQIGLSIVSNESVYIDETPNHSSRTYASLIITPAIEMDKQVKLVEEFNKFLADHRKKTHSLFLTNYRESKDIARKRISFDLVYSIVEYILDQLDNPIP